MSDVACVCIVVIYNSRTKLCFYRSMLYSNGAVMPSYDVRPSVRMSVCLSVTLVDCDHIRWSRWNFITRL